MNHPSQPPQGGPPRPINPYPQPNMPPQGHVPYGAPPQGAYPQPPQGYPQQPMYPQGQYPMRPTGPSKGVGVIKFLFGGAVALGCGIGLLVAGHEGIGAGIALGLFTGAGVRWMLTGGANVVGKKIPLLPSLAVPLLFAIIGAAGGSAMSASYWGVVEASTFERCAASTNRYDWYDYFGNVPDQFQRTEAKALQMKADVQWEIEQKNYAEVRRQLGRIKTEFNNDKSFDVVIAAAAEGMGKAYDEALAKLNQPGKADEEAEFQVDDDLRKAFGIILKDLRTSASSDVHVAFTNASELEAPAGHELALNRMKQGESVKRAYPDGKVKIIAPGEAFSAKYDSARRNTFVNASQQAFRNVFDSQLLTLQPLAEKEERKGKLVLEVSSLIRRTPTYFNFYETRPDGLEYSQGLLFGVNVGWTFKLFDREGKQIYARETLSEPASNISIEDSPNAPEWSVYSILMDSAYYNYSREVIGLFGLVPPAQKVSFKYQAYGG